MNNNEDSFFNRRDLARGALAGAALQKALNAAGTSSAGSSFHPARI